MSKKTLSAVIAVMIAVCLVLLCSCSGKGKLDVDSSKTPEPESGKDTFNIEEAFGIGEGAFEKPAPALKITQNPIATITLGTGETIKIELYYNDAPNTVLNFISLANKGFYDGSIFHRVISNFMIQGGSPDHTGSGTPGYDIKGEFAYNGFYNNIAHTRGTISMGRFGAGYNAEGVYSNNYDSAGCQFFICQVDYPSLDGSYAAFGKVIEGIAVVDAVANVETDANYKPLEDVVIKSVTVDTFGIEYPEPEIIK